MMLPVVAQFARAATHERASSALPEAPVTHDREERQPAAQRGRRLFATALRRTADRLEPAPSRSDPLPR